MSTFRRAAPPPERASARPTAAQKSPTQPAATSRAQPPQRQRPPVDEGERLSKRVMQIKGCSRSEAERYIEGGYVLVDGVVVEDPPFRVQRQLVTVAHDATLLEFTEVTLILHKPAGWLDGVDDDDQEAHRAPGKKPRPKNARTLLTAANHSASDASGIRMLQRHLRHLEAEVPLETGASGLVVFTQDWRISRKLGEDLGTMEHELIVDVRGEVQPEQLQAIGQLLANPRERLPHTRFSVNSSAPQSSKLRFAIKGAHPGLVAYLCGKAGLEITAMRRIRLGRVALTDLPVGQWRYLAAHEKF